MRLKNQSTENTYSVLIWNNNRAGDKTYMCRLRFTNLSGSAIVGNVELKNMSFDKIQGRLKSIWAHSVSNPDDNTRNFKPMRGSRSRTQ